jgi:4-aminobutyrate--pyruvate transaminase
MMQAMMDQGLLLRVVGDTINFSPPLIITEAEIDEMMRRFTAALETLPREAA